MHVCVVITLYPTLPQFKIYDDASVQWDRSIGVSLALHNALCCVALKTDNKPVGDSAGTVKGAEWSQSERSYV